MPSGKVYGAKGLWTSPSYLEAPVGSFGRADNTVVDTPGLVQCRRGLSWLSYVYGQEAGDGQTIFSFQGTLLINYTGFLTYDTGTSFVDVPGTASAPDPTVLRMQAQEAGNNLHYTTSEGVQVLDTPSSNPRISGVTRGPAPTGRTDPTRTDGDPDTGWLEANSQTAYVATWGVTDADGTVHEGDPSTAFYLATPQGKTFSNVVGNRVTAPTGTTARQVSLPTPHGLQIGDKIEIFFDTPNALFADGIKTVANLGRVLDGSEPLTVFTFTGVFNAGADAVASAGSYQFGTKNVRVVADVDPYIAGEVIGAGASYTYRLYRAYQSGVGTVPPRPQYYLSYEHEVTSAEATAGKIVYVDETPDSLLQDPLYTNTDDGEPPDSSLQNDNSRAPTATDVTLFDSRLWGANYTDRQFFQLALLGVASGGSGTNGLQIGDTISIGPSGSVRTYTAVAYDATPTPTQFNLWDIDDPETNVQKTAQSLALTITNYALSDVNAYYTSGVDDIPGQMLLQNRNTDLLDNTAFMVYVSRVSAWGPEMTTSSTNALTSTIDAATNGLWYSKQNQPEAVPLLNRMRVGPNTCRILRIKPLRDQMYVFTDIAGVWTVSNSYPYVIKQLTQTAALVGPDTLVSFNDSLYALTSQGVASIDETGPKVISIPIEGDIKRLFGASLPTLKRQAFGVGYESARKYILAMPTEPTDTYNTQAFVYDIVTRTWTRWTKEMTAMVVVPQTDILYAISPLNNHVLKERKNFDRSDYADEDFAVTIVGAVGKVVELASVDGVTAGDLLYVDAITNAIIVSVDEDASTVTTYDTVEWTPGAASVYVAIDVDLVYSAYFSGSPEDLKHYRELTYHFRTPSFILGNAVFYSDVNPAEAAIEIPMAEGGFGDISFEDFSWEQPGGPANKRAYVPTDSQRPAFLSVGFQIRQAWAQWMLAGFTLTYTDISERNSTR